MVRNTVDRVDHSEDRALDVAEPSEAEQDVLDVHIESSTGWPRSLGAIDARRTSKLSRIPAGDISSLGRVFAQCRR